MTKVGLDAIGTSTTLESNKSLARMFLQWPTSRTSGASEVFVNLLDIPLQVL